MDQNAMARTDRDLGGTGNSSTESKGTSNPSFKMDKTGQPWDDVETEYLRTHWRTTGPTATKVWNTVSLHLHRTIDDCKAEYRKLTNGKAAKKAIEKKKVLVKAVETHVYNADQEIIALFKNLPLFMRCLIAELPSLGEVDEMNLNVSAGMLTVSFKRDKAVASIPVETGAGMVDIEI